MGGMLLPHTRASAAAMRRRLRAELQVRGFPPAIVDDAALIMSELVGNALLHARPLPGGGIRATWHQEDEALVLAVSDGGGATRPQLQCADPTAQGGRGLAIVDSLAALDIAATPDAVTVTATLSVGSRLELIPSYAAGAN